MITPTAFHWSFGQWDPVKGHVVLTGLYVFEWELVIGEVDIKWRLKNCLAVRDPAEAGKIHLG